jgi:hypothetical protein
MLPHLTANRTIPIQRQQPEGRPAMAARPTGAQMRAVHRRVRRPSHSRRYAIVPDWATLAQYIWDPDTDAWYGPWATCWDAERTLARWRAARQTGAH